MQPPFPTNISIEMLDMSINRALYGSSGQSSPVGLRRAGITRVWHLLLFTPEQLDFPKFRDERRRGALIERMRRAGLVPGALSEFAGYWLRKQWIDDRRWSRDVYLFEAVNGDRYNVFSEQHGKELDHFSALHGHRPGTTWTSELFVYVPAERPALTDAQVAFLRCDALKAFGLTCSSPPTDHANVFDASFLHEIGCDGGTVWDVMLVLMHLREGNFGGSPARLRKKIEAVLGPLPLALTSNELARVLAID